MAIFIPAYFAIDSHVILAQFHTAPRIVHLFTFYYIQALSMLTFSATILDNRISVSFEVTTTPANQHHTKELSGIVAHQ